MCKKLAQFIPNRAGKSAAFITTTALVWPKPSIPISERWLPLKAKQAWLSVQLHLLEIDFFLAQSMLQCTAVYCSGLTLQVNVCMSRPHAQSSTAPLGCLIRVLYSDWTQNQSAWERPYSTSLMPKLTQLCFFATVTLICLKFQNAGQHNCCSVF